LKVGNQRFGERWPFNSSRKQHMLPVSPLVVLLEQGQDLGGQEVPKTQSNRRPAGRGLPRQQVR
jgi:hypothetical protein